ncbi:MAG: copper resistance protein NlpE [Chitinophagales bacterium]|nr:copper resistance protein NlpE [Chitinophagales bacterium]
MKKLLYVLGVTMALTACRSGSGENPLSGILNTISDPKEDLIGSFSERESGRIEYKIYKEDGKYFLYMEGGNGIKSETEELVDGIEVAQNTLKREFGDEWKSYVEAALVMKDEHSFGFFKVKKGYEYKGHTFTTGYYAQFWGRGDVYKVESEKIKEEVNSKNLIMTFKEYSEGDYPHFIFEDQESKKGYDFRFISDNNLGNLPILLDDDEASFGLKANPKFIGKSFNVNIVKKEVLDMGLDGNTIKSKEWVIEKISLAKVEEPKLDLPFVGEKWGGNSRIGYSVTINANGSIVIKSNYLGKNEYIIYSGRYASIMKAEDSEYYYKIDSDKMTAVDKKGNIETGCDGIIDQPCEWILK